MLSPVPAGDVVGRAIVLCFSDSYLVPFFVFLVLTLYVCLWGDMYLLTAVRTRASVMAALSRCYRLYLLVVEGLIQVYLKASYTRSLRAAGVLLSPVACVLRN
jgi:hypothetical protein